MQITKFITNVTLGTFIVLLPITLVSLSGCTQTVAKHTIEEDKLNLYRGDYYLNKQLYQQAISEYNKILPNSPIYSNAQKKIRLAKRKINEANATPIDKASDAWDEGDFSGAMKILTAIPKKSQYYTEAQTMIKKIIKENAKNLADEGIENINQGNYYIGGVQLYKAKKDDPTLAETANTYIPKAADFLLNEGLKQHRAQTFDGIKEAIKNWGQILDFDPDNEKAKAFYTQAVKELELLKKLNTGK